VTLTTEKYFSLFDHHPTKTTPITMKFTPLFLALAAVPAFAGDSRMSAPASSSAPVLSGGVSAPSGWYAGVVGSALWMEDIGYNVDFPFGDLEIDSNFKTGWGVTIPFGYRFSNGFSLGMSAGYYTADLDDVTIKFDGDTLGDVRIDADPSLVPLLANVSYSIGLTEALSLNLGGGVGVAYHEFDLDEIEGFRYDSSSDGWDFSWQVFGGFSYNVAQNTDLTIGYRYIFTETDVDDLKGHNVEAGVIVRF